MHTTLGRITLPMLPNEKSCSVCKNIKPLEDFCKQPHGKFGRKAQCRVCENEYGKAYFKKSFASNPERYWEKHLLADHHLPLEDYYKLLAEQGGLCAICLKPPRQQGRKFRLSVDHDHRCCPSIKSCGKCIRGLVCHTCNVSLGLMQDDPTLLRLAAQYLERCKK
jgi:hypothetical protein